MSGRTHNSVTADRTATAPPDTGSVAGMSVAYSHGPSDVGHVRKPLEIKLSNSTYAMSPMSPS
jgi:hypothetical protein